MVRSCDWLSSDVVSLDQVKIRGCPLARQHEPMIVKHGIGIKSVEKKIQDAG